MGHAESLLFTKVIYMKSWAAKLLILPPENILHRPTRALSYLMLKAEWKNGLRMFCPMVNIQFFKEGDKFLEILNKLQGKVQKRICLCELNSWGAASEKGGKALPATVRSHGQRLSTLSTRSRHQPPLLHWIYEQNRRHIPARSFPTFLN